MRNVSSHGNPERDRAAKAKALIARGVQSLLRYPALRTQRRVFISATTEPKSFTVLELQDNLTKAGFDVVNPVELRDLNADSMQVWERLRKMILTCDYFVTLADGYPGQVPQSVPPAHGLVNSISRAAKLTPKSICQWEFATAMASAQTVGLPKMFVYRTRGCGEDGNLASRPLESGQEALKPVDSQAEFLGFLDDLRSLTAGDWTDDTGNRALETILQEEDLSSGGRLFGADDHLDKRWQRFHEKLWDAPRKVLICCDAKQDVADTVNLAEYIEGPHYSPITLLLPEDPVQARVHPLQEIREMAAVQFRLLSLQGEMDSAVRKAGDLEKACKNHRRRLLVTDGRNDGFVPQNLVSGTERQALDEFRNKPLEMLRSELASILSAEGARIAGSTWTSRLDLELIANRLIDLLDKRSRHGTIDSKAAWEPTAEGEYSGKFDGADKAFDIAFQAAKLLATPIVLAGERPYGKGVILPSELNHLRNDPLVIKIMAEGSRLMSCQDAGHAIEDFNKAFRLLELAELDLQEITRGYQQLKKYGDDLTDLLKSTNPLIPYRAAASVFSSAVTSDIAIFLFSNPDPLTNSFENRVPIATNAAAASPTGAYDDDADGEFVIPGIHAEILRQLLDLILPEGRPPVRDSLVITARGLEERVRMRITDLPRAQAGGLEISTKQKRLEAWMERLRNLQSGSTATVNTPLPKSGKAARIQWHESAQRRQMIPKALAMLLRARQWRVQGTPDPVDNLRLALVECLHRNPEESLHLHLNQNAEAARLSQESCARRILLTAVGSTLLLLGTAAGLLLMFTSPVGSLLRYLIPGIPLVLGAILASAGIFSRSHPGITAHHQKPSVKS